MSKKKKDKIKQKMSLPRKITLSVIGAIVLVIAIVAVYKLIHYRLHRDYKKYVETYDYEEGTEFKALSDSGDTVPGMELVAENDNIKLYTNTENGEVALLDKRNGNITYSNPQNIDDDPIANETNKNYMRSQLVIDYYNAARAMGTYDSYTMSVLQDKLEVQSIKDGVRYIFTIGDFSQNSSGIVPIYITQEKLDEVCANLSEGDARTIRRYYSGVDEASGMIELNPVTQKTPMRMRTINELFKKAGFTEEEYIEMMEMAGKEPDIPMSFVIPVEYRLTDDGMKVSIPASQIQEMGGGKLFRIRLLSFLGASGTDEEGYMVVPNGSGSIINFNNGKSAVGNYSQYIYDMDPMSADYTQLENTEKARLPICGICREDSSVLINVTDGTSTAFFTAGVSGSITSYNNAYATFVVRGYDLLSMFGSTGNEADLPILESDIYDVNYTVEYSILDEENAGYAGIANYYRNKLVSEGILTEKTENGDIPFYYDIIGGVKETASFAGIRYLRVLSMTDFDEAADIAKDLQASGISNQVMNYQGWSNGGYYADVYDKITGLGKLGGKGDLEALNETMQSIGGTLYVDVPFQNVTSISKRYSSSDESSRYYAGGYVAEFGVVNPTTFRKTSSLGYDENLYALISPKFLERYVSKFADKIQKYDVDGICVRDLGNELHSDKKRTEVIDRELALNIVEGQFDILEDTGKKIMVNGGNNYSFQYAEHITNAPIKDNDFRIIDEEIPLYEMIIHGCIDYSGSQLNYHDDIDTKEITLKMIEYGASPHYVFTEESASEMKYTALNTQYATKYENWKSDAVDMYNAVNSALKDVSGETIVNHEILQEGVRRVTYSNGTQIYVNYTDSDVTVDGVTVSARNYTEVAK